MRAILEVGDMRVFGDARLYGLDIVFEGTHFKLKRKIKSHPIDLAIKRLKKGTEPKIMLTEDGVIFTDSLLSYGISMTLRQSFLNARFKLRDAR